MIYCSPYSNTPLPSATLSSLLDVVITSPTQGQSLLYNATTGKWENSSSVGTVTSVAIATANGISGTVANPNTTPTITLTLGAITPSSVAATGTVTGSNLSGTNTGDQTITLTSDVTGSGTGSIPTTISNQAVTYSKIQNVSANNRLLGRATSGAGSVEEISLGSGLLLTGNQLSIVESNYPQVNTYNDLPITLGTPPLGSIYVVLSASGIWLLNRKEAGLYRRTGNTGSLTDWERLGNWSDISKDSNFQLVNSTDNTKLGKFDLSSISPNTLRTLSFPDASGTIALTSGGIFTGTIQVPQIKTIKQNLTPTGTTQTIDWNNGSIIELSVVSATGNVTLSFSNAQEATSYIIKVTQGTTPRNLIFPSGTLQSGGGGNIYTSTANSKDIIALLWDGSTYFINVSKNYS